LLALGALTFALNRVSYARTSWSRDILSSCESERLCAQLSNEGQVLVDVGWYGSEATAAAKERGLLPLPMTFHGRGEAGGGGATGSLRVVMGGVEGG